MNEAIGWLSGSEIWLGLLAVQADFGDQEMTQLCSVSRPAAGQPSGVRAPSTQTALRPLSTPHLRTSLLAKATPAVKLLGLGGAGAGAGAAK